VTNCASVDRFQLTVCLLRSKYLFFQIHVTHEKTTNMEEIKDIIQTIVRGSQQGGVIVSDILAAFVARTVSFVVVACVHPLIALRHCRLLKVIPRRFPLISQSHQNNGKKWSYGALKDCWNATILHWNCKSCSNESVCQ
jgi:hypothetical protein